MSQQGTKDKAKHFYRASAADFMKIPGSPVAYWISTTILSLFDKPPIGDLFFSEGPCKTGNDDVFLRFHWEVQQEEIGPDSKWCLCSKGGVHRKYYGNVEHVIKWDVDARNHYKKDRISRITSEHVWDEEGVTWSIISSESGFSFRLLPVGVKFNSVSPTIFASNNLDSLSRGVLAFLNSSVASSILSILNPTLALNVGNVLSLPVIPISKAAANLERILEISIMDWDSYETSFNFESLPLLDINYKSSLRVDFQRLRECWQGLIFEVKNLEEANNSLFIDSYGLQYELTSEVPLREITLTSNPYHCYGSKRTEDEYVTLLSCDTIRELVSYAVGCMMGRYSLDKPGLILASQGETLQDYREQIPAPKFAPDENAILPLTDQEWFPDDATNRFREFVRVVWGDEHLQENLDFVAESLCLHAIKSKRGESALDTIRRYLSTQFCKDHLRTYKKRPIYWLFSSGKHKAFECLVYLHRYNESTLARMRTEYVIPLSAKLKAYAEKLEQDKDASTSTAETKRLEKEVATLHKQQTELAEFDEKLRHYADQRISLDLDDGVKVNYGKFGDLLAEVKAVTGQK